MLLSFSAPASDGGAPVSGYDASCTASGGATGTASATTAPIRVRGLTNGASYTCSVTATNDFGTSDAATTGPVVPEPTVSVGDASVLEGDSATRILRFPVSSSRPVTSTVSVPYTVVDSNATGAAKPGPGVDYKTRTGTVTFSPGASGLTTVMKTLSVTVYGDTAAEGDEYVHVVLDLPTGGVILGRGDASGAILDDEGSIVRAGIGDATVVEGDAGNGRKLVFAVTLSSPSSSAVSIPFTIAGLDATYGKTATSTADFGGKLTGTVSFPLQRSGVTAVSKTVTIPVWADVRGESDESLQVTLGPPTGPVDVLRGVGTGWILTDDDF